MDGKTRRVLLACAGLAFGAPASAGLIGGFEQGLRGWDSMGDVSVQSSDIGLDPTQGHAMAFITTMCDRDNPPAQVLGGVSPCQTTTNEHPYSGVSSPYAGFARTFLGLPFDTLELREAWPDAGPVSTGESGALRTEFYAPQAGELSFDWNRIGADGDGAYFSLWSGDGSDRMTDWIFDARTFTGTFAPSGVDLCSRYHDGDEPNPACAGFLANVLNVETGWSTRSVTVGAPGWYTLGFALAEIAEGTVPTVLALDNVRFKVTPLPEPATWAIALLGLAALGVVRGRRR